MSNVKGNSDEPEIAGVLGTSTTYNGVLGYTTAAGHAGVAGACDEGDSHGVYGRSKNRNGVLGVSSAAEHSGVTGLNDNGTGVLGKSTNSRGVWGLSDNSVGVVAQTRSENTPALQAFQSNPSSNSFALHAKHDGGKTAGFFEGGVWGTSETNEGVHAETKSTFFAAIAGISLNSNRDPGGGSSAGIFGKSEAGEGVHGETNSNLFAAVAGIQLNPNSTGAGVYGEHRGNGPAGFFKGDVIVTGDVKLINADCAEDFDIADLAKAEPGTVMVIDSEGALQESYRAYDKRVAGVISGAGSYKPALILDKQESSKNRMPIALMGKVYCKVDASYGAIEVGDLLTTSPTLGHAMKADDPMKAFGSVIGKALRPLASGEGLIPILIALQ